MNWIKFAFEAKDRKENTLYNAMKANDPTLGSNYEVIYTISNEVQYNFIDNHKIDLVNFLRKELNNYSLSLTLRIEATKDEQLFSSKDKFKDMAERNVHLKQLRDRFGLDIDY